MAGGYVGGYVTGYVATGGTSGTSGTGGAGGTGGTGARINKIKTIIYPFVLPNNINSTYSFYSFFNSKIAKNTQDDLTARETQKVKIFRDIL